MPLTANKNFRVTVSDDRLIAHLAVHGEPTPITAEELLLEIEALGLALDSFGLKGDDQEALRHHLPTLAESRIETYLYHELGEIRDRNFDRDIWGEIIASFPHSAVELLARGIKDLLADTNEHGTLQHMVMERSTGPLALYVAFQGDFSKTLFPELKDAFHVFLESREWPIIEQAVAAGYRTAKDYAESISSIYRAGKKRGDLKWSEDEIGKKLLEPLGIGKPN